MNEFLYDCLIIGGGPAGYTAAIYSARAGFKTVVIEKYAAGGQMTQTNDIDNYPGFEDGTDGYSLGEKMKKGAERFGAETVQAEVLSVNLTENPKSVVTSKGEYRTKTVIIASGARHRQLGLENENTLIGKGVAYCAACDGMFYRGKRVVVIGGGNSAAADALLLSKLCSKVILVHRRDSLRAEKFYRDMLKKASNIEFEWNSTVSEITAGEKVNGVILNTPEGKKHIPADGVFISIGRDPETEIFKNQIALDNHGYITAGEDTKTNIPGVFAAGDVRTKAFRQIVTAASDGAVSAHFAEEFLALTPNTKGGFKASW